MIDGRNTRTLNKVKHKRQCTFISERNSVALRNHV